MFIIFIVKHVIIEVFIVIIIKLVFISSLVLDVIIIIKVWLQGSDAFLDAFLVVSLELYVLLVN